MSSLVGGRLSSPLPSTRSSSSCTLRSTSLCWLQEYRAAVSVEAVVSCPAPITSCTSSHSSASVKDDSDCTWASSSDSSRSPLRSAPAFSSSRRWRISGITSVDRSPIASSISTMMGTRSLLIIFSKGVGVTNILPILSCNVLMLWRIRSVGILFPLAHAPRRAMASSWPKSWLKATMPTISKVSRCICTATSVSIVAPSFSQISQSTPALSQTTPEYCRNIVFA
mmetsp:Transcript_10308/g.17751  ORF Transcript_10308/g.17751 Transcript_10308/m.17751 type:complete len:225 (+) Transcript_10308:742-1416(+)